MRSSFISFQRAAELILFFSMEIHRFWQIIWRFVLMVKNINGAESSWKNVSWVFGTLNRPVQAHFVRSKDWFSNKSFGTSVNGNFNIWLSLLEWTGIVFWDIFEIQSFISFSGGRFEPYSILVPSSSSSALTQALEFVKWFVMIEIKE